jgi:Rad3-related DNA helicase
MGMRPAMSVNFSQIVPDGMLVFFPSYGVMADTLQAWQNAVGRPRPTRPASPCELYLYVCVGL